MRSLVSVVAHAAHFAPSGVLLNVVAASDLTAHCQDRDP
jgi:hypothetical protein